MDDPLLAPVTVHHRERLRAAERHRRHAPGARPRKVRHRLRALRTTVHHLLLAVARLPRPGSR